MRIKGISPSSPGGAGAGAGASGRSAYRGSGSGGGGGVTANAIVQALRNDTACRVDLARELLAVMLDDAGFARELVAAMRRVVEQSQATGPGSLLAGTVSTLAGAIQSIVVGTSPGIAMVFVNGSSVAVPVYIPSHIYPDLSAGQEVWVEPVNGRMDDLWIVGIRNFQQTPAASLHNLVMLAAPVQVWTAAAVPNAGVGLTVNARTLAALPAGAVAAYVQGFWNSATAGDTCVLGPGTVGAASATNHYLIFGGIQVANQALHASGMVPMDASGNIAAFGVTAAGTLSLWVAGYLT